MNMCSAEGRLDQYPNTVTALLLGDICTVSRYSAEQLTDHLIVY